MYIHSADSGSCTFTFTCSHCFPVRLNTRRCAVAASIRNDRTQQFLDPVDSTPTSYSGDIGFKCRPTLLFSNHPSVWRCYSSIILQFDAIVQQPSFSLTLLFINHPSILRYYSATILQFDAVILQPSFNLTLLFSNRPSVWRCYSSIILQFDIIQQPSFSLTLLFINHPSIWRYYSATVLQFDAVIQQSSFSFALLFSSHHSVWRCYSVIIIQLSAIHSTSFSLAILESKLMTVLIQRRITGNVPKQTRATDVMCGS